VSDEQRLSACVHEAGHAVAAGSFGYTVHTCRVDEDGIGGYTGFGRPEGDLHTPAGWWRDLVVTAAGQLAEVLHRGDDPKKAVGRLVEEWLDLLELGAHLDDALEGDGVGACETLALARDAGQDPEKLARDAAEAAALIPRERRDDVLELAQRLLAPPPASD
jgi:hypothetical protein